MADAAIHLNVLTQEGLVIEDQAVSVVAPGGRGYVGFLRNHAPLVTTVKPGKLTWRRPSGETKTARLGSGLLEIQRNTLTILTDAFTPTEAAAHE